MLGRPDQEMFEAYTLLGALAARTERVRLGTLVTGVTYREPGAAGQGRHRARRHLQRPGPPRHRRGVVRRRARGARLRVPAAEGALRAPGRRPGDLPGDVHPADHDLRGHAPHRQGRLQLAGAGRRPIPILIGGQGEKRTFRIAAQYADELNTTAAFADLPRKLDALQGHLDDLGRPRSDITVTPLGTLVLAETHDAALAKLKA